MVAGLLALLAFPFLAVQGEKNRISAEHLIQQLDSDSPEERDAAEKELLAAGEEVEASLLKAVEHGKPEVRARCRDLLSQIALARKRREFWNPSKPISISAKETPLKEILAMLSKASGCSVRAGDVDAELRVSVAVEGASFLQALEAVCRASQAWYRWNGAAVELLKSETPRSIAHAGPVLFVPCIGPSRDDGDLCLNLRIEWEPGIRLRWYELEIESAEDDHGAAVTVAPSRSPAGFAHRLVYFRSNALPREGEARFATDDHVDLSATNKDTPLLKSVKGRIRLFMPEEVTKLRVEHGAGDLSRQLGLLTATVGVFKGSRDWGAKVELDLRNAPPSKHSALFAYLLTAKIRGIDSEGKGYEMENHGASSSGNTAVPLQRVSTSVQNNTLPESRTPAALEATLVTDVWEKSYPFELKNVERPKTGK